MTEPQPQLNTDRELFRERAGEPSDYYNDSIFVTIDEKIGMNVGGLVFVAPIAEWHKLMKREHAIKDYLNRPRPSSQNEQQRPDGSWEKAVPFPFLGMWHWKCPECKRWCLTMRSYRRHYRLVHSD